MCVDDYSNLRVFLGGPTIRQGAGEIRCASQSVHERPGGAHSYLSQLTLSRLRRTSVEAMVENVTSGKALPVDVVQQIVAKTDGVPLFVEELTKTVVESGLLIEADGHYELRSPLPPLAIPSTLQDSLMARLDRLAAVNKNGERFYEAELYRLKGELTLAQSSG